jgi:simple sugar transport system substrate-binding protein
MIKEGKKPPHLVRGGLKDNLVKCSPYGPAVSDGTKKKIEAAKADAMAGTLVIFKGPLKDNTGTEVIPTGKQFVQTDPALEGIQYLVEGVIGSAK